MRFSFSPRIRRAAALLTVGTAVTLAFAGTSSRTAQAQPAPDRIPSALVGRVAESDALIGLITDGNRVLAYVCDSQYNAVWFKGEVSSVSLGNALELRGDGGARLRIETSALSTSVLEGSNVSVQGAVELAGATFERPFEVLAVQGNAGVFRAEAVNGDRIATAGWIINNDGDLRGGAVVKEFNTGNDVLLETFGLDSASLDIETLTGVIPDFGTVDVQRINIESLGRFFDDQDN